MNQRQQVNIFIMNPQKRTIKRKMNPKSLKNLKPKKMVVQKKRKMNPKSLMNLKQKALPKPEKKVGMVERFFRDTTKVVGGMVNGATHYAMTTPYTKDKVQGEKK